MRRNACILPLAVSLIALEVAPAAVSFEDPLSYTVGTGPRDIATADVNQDGAPRVITADYAVDLGNGSYRFPVASLATGVGVASVSVEGVLLQDAPSVLFQQP